MAPSPPLRIWAVSDGRAGIENQVLGLSEAISRLTPAEIDTRHLRYAPLFDRLPTALKLWPDAMLEVSSDRVAPPYPDIWIAAGRATLPHSLRMRERSGGRTLIVQLQDPKESLDAFDMVIAPAHDGVEGKNVLSQIGSTHRVTPQKLNEAVTEWADRLGPLPHPRLAVLIGGRSKTHDLSVSRAQHMADDIRRAVQNSGGSLLLTVSRRTPDAVKDVLLQTLKDLPGIIYTGDGPNPLFAFLGAADHILVTEDSVNMATEAAITGKPVHILSMDTLRPSPKFATFHQALRDQGIARPFEGALTSWTYTPLNETERAARAVLERFDEIQRSRRIVG